MSHGFQKSIYLLTFLLCFITKKAIYIAKMAQKQNCIEVENENATKMEFKQE